MRRLTGALLAAALLAAIPATADAATRDQLTLGIYPAGYAAVDTPDPAKDDYPKIISSLNTLQGQHRQFGVRAYADFNPDPRHNAVAPFVPFLGHGRKLDLVLVHDPSATPQQWLDFVRAQVRYAGPFTNSLSLGVDANIPGLPWSMSRDDLVNGLAVAKQEARHTGLKIGFDVAAGPQDTDFWTSLKSANLRPDFIGVEVYPDVWFPAPGDHGQQAVGLLTDVRDTKMPLAGFGSSVPIMISENGYTSDTAGHTQADQAAALKSEFIAITGAARRLNITAYDLYMLRDHPTVHEYNLDHLGLLNADYSPKPAWRTMVDLYRAYP
ncbi:hypothetical protein D5S17_30825 [Pseudonocardiaceae bacterium YIM PH 21723]|nr:hypothetical protein D5S17_30825 [Pseudonocardiaceae bacterium YIM PH 21723]